MIDPTDDLTALTHHPQWTNFAALIQKMVTTQVIKLSGDLDADANYRLRFLTDLKFDIRQRTENKDLWNV